jgi:hypothetical protein
LIFLDEYTSMAYILGRETMVIVETSIFTRRVMGLLPDEEYRLLQATLVDQPDAGPIIPGRRGYGKSAGAPPAMEKAAAHASSIIGLSRRTVS